MNGLHIPERGNRICGVVAVVGSGGGVGCGGVGCVLMWVLSRKPTPVLHCLYLIVIGLMFYICTFGVYVWVCVFTCVHRAICKLVDMYIPVPQHISYTWIFIFLELSSFPLTTSWMLLCARQYFKWWREKSSQRPHALGWGLARNKLMFQYGMSFQVEL